MYGDAYSRRDRVGSLVAVAVIHVALGYALLSGLAVDFPRRIAESLETFAVVLPPPPTPQTPPRPKPVKQRAPRKEGAASPPNLTAKATELVAPPVVIPPPKPPPMVTAPKASTGAADHSGAAPVPGPGTGSGGIGDGTGSGSSGDGPGGGGDGGEGFELTSRNIRDADFPRGMPDDGHAYRVRTKITVGTSGRVTGCAIIAASASAALNSAICDVLRRRLRFRPSIDARGRPFVDYAIWEHIWTSGSYDPDY